MARKKISEGLYEIDTDENLRVVTRNDFVQGCGMENASLKATKLLYIAISQCRVTDHEFYEYVVTVPEFAALMDIEPTHVYQEADSLTDELMKAFVRTKHLGRGHFAKYTVFAKCEYDGSEIRFKINKEMTDFLLGITSDFTKPLLDDFLRMKSVYSIRVWHLLQMAMKSQKPAFAIEGQEPEYYLSLEELRRVTGTENKLKQVGQFKERVLDKALREIEECAGVRMTYRNKKHGKTVVGFVFKVVPVLTIPKEKAEQIEEKWQQYEELPEEMKDQISWSEYLDWK